MANFSGGWKSGSNVGTAWHGVVGPLPEYDERGEREEEKWTRLKLCAECHATMLLCCHIDMLFTGSYLTTI